MSRRGKLRQVYARITGFYSGMDHESVLNSLRVVNHMNWLFGNELHYTEGDDDDLVDESE